MKPLALSLKNAPLAMAFLIKREAVAVSFKTTALAPVFFLKGTPWPFPLKGQLDLSFKREALAFLLKGQPWPWPFLEKGSPGPGPFL